jgi:hypothetical protein
MRTATCSRRPICGGSGKVCSPGISGCESVVLERQLSGARSGASVITPNFASISECFTPNNSLRALSLFTARVGAVPSLGGRGPQPGRKRKSSVCPHPWSLPHFSSRGCGRRSRRSCRPAPRPSCRATAGGGPAPEGAGAVMALHRIVPRSAREVKHAISRQPVTVGDKGVGHAFHRRTLPARRQSRVEQQRERGTIHNRAGRRLPADVLASLIDRDAVG